MRHLNTIVDVIRWLVIPTGRYVNMVLQVTDQYCEHVPERVKNDNDTTIMWYVPVITDRTILVNRPGVVLHDKTEKTCLLIDVAIPDDSNGNTKETGKISRYVRRPGDRVQQDVGSEDKNCTGYNWSIRNN